MSASFPKLRSKLSELFQLDAAAELDFGIYRILNARRVEIGEFLDSLEGQVDGILGEALGSGSGETKAELEKTIANLRDLSVDDEAIENNKKVKELRAKLAAAGSDPTALSHEIFSHLLTFFSRYYKDGDFISLRRYKKDTYAIPYEGEEVKLHWANADQYYIKSSETLRDYAFRLGTAPKDDKPDTRPTVSFKLVEADVEKDNTKALAGQERRFVFEEGGSGVSPDSSSPNLILHFAYLPVGKTEKQAALNEAAAKTILAEYAKGAFTGLAANDPTYTVKSKTRSILAKHLTEYTGRNTFDYFIHKDLGGFLRRELDFYIKNEVLHLDDLDDAPEANWNETRAKLKALRAIAAKVIRFLAQLEDFQKKLWLKKKFVTACDYVVTLDRIPEELYPEIAACDAQREEWVKLFAIDEIKGDLGRAGYSKPLKVDFLKENQGLPVNTQWLDSTSRVKEAAKPDGVLISADNFQGLSFIDVRHRSKVNCAFIDPPYNTGTGDFSYKDNYFHSSWLSMMSDRLALNRSLLSRDGALWCSLDSAESARFWLLAEDVFSARDSVSHVTWQHSVQSKGYAGKIAVGHNNLFCVPRSSDFAIGTLVRTDENNQSYANPDNDPKGLWRTGYLVNSLYRPNLIYDVPTPSGNIISPPGNGWRYSWSTMQEKISTGEIFFSPDESRIIRKIYLSNQEGHVPSSVWLGKDCGTSRSANLDLKSTIPGNQFTTSKPIELVGRAINLTCGKSGIIADCFAGSGTTGHAVINLNREDGGDRKFILIEMGEHFDTVLVPRLKKVIYSKDWKDGKPQSRNTGISHCFKILRLESYDDTLNNLRLHRTRAQELALEAMSDEAKEDYRLGYMLDLEASGSQSLLNVSAFTDPWNYSLEIASGTAGETKPTKVDLVETFNWLLGLTVLAQGGGQDKKSGGVQWVEGTNPEGDKVLVLWRNTTEVTADALNDWCKKQKVSVLDGEFGLIYINGDHHLENLRREDQTWKVRLTDEEFPKLMWEGC